MSELTVRLAGTSCENCGQLLTPGVQRHGRTYVGSIASEISGKSAWLEGDLTEHTAERCRAARREDRD